MSTIIRGGSITVDGLAPSGGGDNNPTVDNLTVNGNISLGGNIYVGGGKTTGKSFIIQSGQSLTYTPVEGAPYLVFFSITNGDDHALYKVYNGGKTRLLGKSTMDSHITHSGFTITITNPQSWAVPVYIWSA